MITNNFAGGAATWRVGTRRGAAWWKRAVTSMMFVPMMNRAAPGGARWRGRLTCGRDEPCPPKIRICSAGRFKFFAALHLQLATLERAEAREATKQRPASA